MMRETEEEMKLGGGEGADGEGADDRGVDGVTRHFNDDDVTINDSCQSNSTVKEGKTVVVNSEFEESQMQLDHVKIEDDQSRSKTQEQEHLSHSFSRQKHGRNGGENSDYEQPTTTISSSQNNRTTTEQRCNEPTQQPTTVATTSIESKKIIETVARSNDLGISSRSGEGCQRQLTSREPWSLNNGEPAQSNGKESSENADLISIHCVIERLKDDEMTSPETTEARHLVFDGETKVSGSIPFRKLVETVLVKNCFHRVDIIGARGFLLPSFTWQPISMETVTRNRLATVRDVIGGLERTLILRIILQKSVEKEHRLKELLLSRLLRLLPNKLLESARCPLAKDQLERLRRSEPLLHLTEALLDSLDDWRCQSDEFLACFFQSLGDHQQTKDIHSNAEDEQTPVSMVDSRGRRDGFSGKGIQSSRSSLEKSTNGTSELDQLEEWFRKNPHPSSSELTGYLEELNRDRRRRSEPVWMMSQLVDWFRGAMTSVTNDVISVPGSNFNRNFSNFDRKRKRSDDADSEYHLNIEHNGVPLLPNRNAVYVVQPLPMDRGALERVEVVRPPSVVERPLSTSSSLGSSGREEESLTEEPLNYASGRSSSDENHNSCTSIPFSDQATDLSVPVKKKTPSDRPLSGWKPVVTTTTTTAELGQQLPVWPVRKFEKNPTSGDYESLRDSVSPRVTSETVQGLHCPVPPPFLYPHYSVARIPPLPPNAIQLAAMSQLFQQSAAAAAFYTSSQSLFPSAVGTTTGPFDRDDHSSSPGSNPGDTDRRKRSRVFIDPNTEIPRLEEWYNQDTHPSALQIEQYTSKLNSADYRQRFPRLETKNVQLWFKNHRAKVKRLANDEDGSSFKVIADREESFPRTNSFST